MATTPSEVTTTGADRSRLLADLTMRLGRIDVVSEREVTLPDGNPGWEVTVRHQPFVVDDAQHAEVGDLSERIEELQREAAAIEEANEAARTELDAERERMREELAAERERIGVIEEEARAEGERIVAEARERAQAITAEAAAAAQRQREEADRLRAQMEKRTSEATDLARRHAEDQAAGTPAEGQRRATELQDQAAAELKAARQQGREVLREARAAAQALLDGAQSEVDVAQSEGQALTETLHEMTEALRQTEKRLASDLQAAHKALSKHTSLGAAQAAAATSPETQSQLIAEEVVRILREEADAADA